MPQPSLDNQPAPFSSVLIANRGEIALRIVRACRDLGIRSIAVYTAPEVNADFVRHADDAWLLEGDTAADTYLNSTKLLDIARTAGAQAIHPGYGYLAESTAFAQAVMDAGLIWIGPCPEAIAALGDKSRARAVAKSVGAPVPPGTGDACTSVDDAREAADRIGYPVAIKAVHGGGGRGFRTAVTPDELDDAFNAATREAQAAFGSGECFLERQIISPRHIETQCLADSHGHVVIASTRDCTLQRRHQKIIEEAPAPGLTTEQEAILTQASRDILAHVGYVGAATCEFLLGADGSLTFMEVNTRIQVEHPVTEEVTGEDLVVWQLRIAAGEHLPEAFAAPRGHSVEFRINAEDPWQNFFPATGRINQLVFPAGPGVRVDSGITEGSDIGVSFDPLLAKIIITGNSRQQAMSRARRALYESALEGVATLLPVHRALLNEDEFASDMTIDTTWLETTFMPRFTQAHLPPAQTSDASGDTAEGEPAGFDMIVEVEGHRMTVKIPATLAGGSAVSAPGTAVAGNVPSGGTRTKPRSLRRRGTTQEENNPVLQAPMQGTIVTVDVSPGDEVKVGDRLAVIEAMKMEQPLLATADAVVKAVHVSAGESVRAQTVLVEFS